MRSLHFAIGSAPLESAVAGARAYMQANGRAPGGSNPSRAIISPSIQSRVAQAYQALPEHDPRATPAFNAMREETARQFDHLTGPRHKGGLGINVNVRSQDPYGDGDWSKVHTEARHDFANNNRLDVLSSKVTGGHPFFTDDENDKFRAVHDAFGHLATGRGVDYHGEEAAFQAHAQMYTPLARQAMASETRGQNAALHASGQFPTQKVALMQPRFTDPRLARLGSAPERAIAAQQARSWNTRQGITN
jgi:hypothetical protein